METSWWWCGWPGGARRGLLPRWVPTPECDGRRRSRHRHSGQRRGAGWASHGPEGTDRGGWWRLLLVDGGGSWRMLHSSAYAQVAASRVRQCGVLLTTGLMISSRSNVRRWHRCFSIWVCGRVTSASSPPHHCHPSCGDDCCVCGWRGASVRVQGRGLRAGNAVLGLLSWQCQSSGRTEVRHTCSKQRRSRSPGHKAHSLWHGFHLVCDAVPARPHRGGRAGRRRTVGRQGVGCVGDSARRLQPKWESLVAVRSSRKKRQVRAA